jgi:hypothetical protein
VTRALALLALALAAPGTGAASEKVAIIAVGDPGAGPDADLAELAHQLRAACRDRVGGVLDVPTMRALLLGQGSNATEAELDRAYGGVLAVYQNGEFESALRTVRAIVDDLESLPETDESYYQWKRAVMRLAHLALASNDAKDAQAAFGKLARIEPGLLPDPDQFSPGYRRRFEEVKAAVKALPRRKLSFTAEGRAGTVYVNGKPMGTTPLTVSLPTGTYRIGGAAGALRVPSFRVELDQEDRTVILDFALADGLRVNAGPGLALAGPSRAYGIIRAGAWLGVEKLIVVSRTEEGQAQFLLGSIFDVQRGALLREGSVRMVAGSVPSVNLAALASFLLTGQSSREVKDLSRDGAKKVPPAPPVASAAAAAEAAPAPKPLAVQPSTDAAPSTPAAGPALGVAPALPPATAPAAPAPPPPAATPRSSPPPSPAPAARVASGEKPAAAPAPEVKTPAAVLLPPTATPEKPALAAGVKSPGEAPAPRPWSWAKPAAVGSGVVAVGLAALAWQQSSAAKDNTGTANQQLLPNHQFKNLEAQSLYYKLEGEAKDHRRNALVCAGGSAAFGITAGVLAWNAWHGHPERGGKLAIAF